MIKTRDELYADIRKKFPLYKPCKPFNGKDRMARRKPEPKQVTRAKTIDPIQEASLITMPEKRCQRAINDTRETSVSTQSKLDALADEWAKKTNKNPRYVLSD